MTPIELLNLSLLKIGVSKGVASLSEESREAWTGALVHDHMLRATLRNFPWSFATKYVALTLTQGPAWTAAPVQAWAADQTYAIGDVVTVASVVYYAVASSLNHTPPNATYWNTTPTTESNGDWVYAYRWPSDCLFARRLVPPGIRRTFDAVPQAFRVGRDLNGLLVYGNVQDAVLEYTMLDCDHLWADDLWIDAFTWRLAGALAPSLSKIADMAKTCQANYEFALARAAETSSREQQLEPNGEAEWIRGR